ncbi:unnamed protein product [Closterium sp. Naga37s-1]|nr:unnamed protein product [Closterium sp. Naga37s-1]
MVLNRSDASAGDKERRVLAICAAVGTVDATVKKRGEATDIYASALVASCAAVWSICRDEGSTADAERGADVAAGLPGAALPLRDLCRRVTAAVMATLGEGSGEPGGKANSEQDRHGARVIDQALRRAGLAMRTDAKVVAKEMIDTLGLWSACTVAADPLRKRGFHMPLSAEMKRKPLGPP